MTDSIFAKAYTDRSNARRAAIKAGLEPVDFKIDGEGKQFRIVKRGTPQAPAKEPDPVKAPAKVEKAVAEAKLVSVPKTVADDELAREIFHVAKPNIRHIGMILSAQQGKMPAAPDLSKPVYASTKKRFLDKIEDAISKNDSAAVMAICGEMLAGRVLTTSLKATATYARLACLAMAAKAA